MGTRGIGENIHLNDECTECAQSQACEVFSVSDCAFLPDSYAEHGSGLGTILKEYQNNIGKYKIMCNSAPDAIFVADAETGIILEANQKAAEILGIPADQIVGMHQSQLHPPQNAEKYGKIFQEHVRSKSSRISEDVYVQHRDGRRIPVQINASVTQINNQKIILGIFRDLTEHNELMAQLQAREEEISAVFESSQDSISVLDKNYTYLYINQAAIESVHMAPGKTGVGKTIDNALGHMPDFMNLWKGRIEEVFRTGKSMRFEDDMFIDGWQICNDSILSPIRYPGSEVFAVSIVSRDVTQQKKTENIIANLAKFPAENPNPVLRINADSVVMYANAAGEELLSKWDASPKKPIPGDWKLPIDEAFSSGSPATFDVQNEEKTFSFFVVPILSEKYVNLYVTEITEEEQLRQQLSDSEKKFRELYENANAALFRTRISDGKLLACSRVTANLFGYSDAAEYLNVLSVTDNYVDPKDRERLLEALKEKGQVREFQAHMKRKDGSLFWVAMSAEVFEAEGYLEGSMIDITAQKILSPAENRVLALLLTGQSNKQIARRLGRSVRTIEDHRSRIMQKFNVDNAFELTQKARDMGFHATKK